LISPKRWRNSQGEPVAHNKDNASSRLSATSVREGECSLQLWPHPAQKPRHATTPGRPFRTCRTFSSTLSRLGTLFYIVRKSSIPPIRLRPAPKPAPPVPASLTLPIGRVQRVYKGGSKGSHAYFPCTPVVHGLKGRRRNGLVGGGGCRGGGGLRFFNPCRFNHLLRFQHRRRRDDGVVNPALAFPSVPGLNHGDKHLLPRGGSPKPAGRPNRAV